jgi:hypothetical protein
VGKWGPEELPPESAPITLKLSAAGAVSGVVKYEDGKVAVRVMVFAQPAEMGPQFGPPQQATTDEAGRFRIGGLEPKGYWVVARRSDNFMSGTPRSRQDVTLTAGEEKTGLELQLPAGGKRIAGRVLSAEGKPVSGALVSAGMEREGFAFRQPVREGGFGSGTQAISDPDGNFAFEDLQDGKYTLWAADSVHADGEVKGVAAGSSDVSIKLQGGASVAGVVQTRDGKPVGDYSIAALPGGRAGASPDERIRNQMMARMWSPSAQVHDPGGAFSIGRLSAGAYELTVTTADNQAGVLAVNVGGGGEEDRAGGGDRGGGQAGGPGDRARQRHPDGRGQRLPGQRHQPPARHHRQGRHLHHRGGQPGARPGQLPARQRRDPRGRARRRRREAGRAAPSTWAPSS